MGGYSRPRHSMSVGVELCPSSVSLAYSWSLIVCVPRRKEEYCARLRSGAPRYPAQLPFPCVSKPPCKLTRECVEVTEKCQFHTYKLGDEK